MQVTARGTQVEPGDDAAKVRVVQRSLLAQEVGQGDESTGSRGPSKRIQRCARPARCMSRRGSVPNSTTTLVTSACGSISAKASMMVPL